MESRSQFTFYESFARALKRIRKDADRAKAYDAIVNYALYGTTPDLDNIPDSAAIAFDLIRPTLDSSARKAKSGKIGGEGKQTASKPEANRKQTGREKEKEKEGEIEKEEENECYILTSASCAHEAVAYFLDRINPAPSSVLTRELLDFCEALGDEVVLHALHIAVDERKTAWSYIKAILNRYKADGLTDITAVQAAEQAHNARKGRVEGSYTPRNEKRPYGGGKRTQEEEQRLAEENRIAMQNINRLWSKMKADA